MASTEQWAALHRYEADAERRGVRYTLHLRNGRALCCAFEYRHLAEFKEVVPQSERFWRPEYKAWEVTLTGAYALIEAHGDKLAPLPVDVIDWLWPAALTGRG